MWKDARRRSSGRAERHAQGCGGGDGAHGLTLLPGALLCPSCLIGRDKMILGKLKDHFCVCPSPLQHGVVWLVAERPKEADAQGVYLTSFQAPTPPWALLETSAGLVTSQDFRTQLLTGYPVAEVVSPQASHPGRRGPRYRSCWHRPIPTNPADIPRAQGQPWPTHLCMQFPPRLTIPTGQSSP